MSKKSKQSSWDHARELAKKFKALGINYEVADSPDHPIYKRPATVSFVTNSTKSKKKS